jgi:hypothetical protein
VSAEDIALMHPGKPAWDTEDALAAAEARGQRLGGFRGYKLSGTNRAQAARARAAVARERIAQALPVIQAAGITLKMTRRGIVMTYA